MNLQIVHLFDHPEHLPRVAGLIHAEFWTEVPGVEVAHLEARLREATDPDRIPLSLLALADGQVAGTVNLVENDDDSRTHLAPWLAALLVVPEWRGRGIGSRLVRELAAQARRLGVERLYLGSDNPGFYERLGAEVHEQPREDFAIMRLDTAAGSEATGSGGAG